jgi:hypothetical protein
LPREISLRVSPPQNHIRKFLHADSPGRMWLAYDALELLRADLDVCTPHWPPS